MQKYYDSDRYQIADNYYYHAMVNNDIKILYYLIQLNEK